MITVYSGRAGSKVIAVTHIQHRKNGTNVVKHEYVDPTDEGPEVDLILFFRAFPKGCWLASRAIGSPVQTFKKIRKKG